MLRLSQSLYFLNSKKLDKFYRTRTQTGTRKNENVELELVKQDKLELRLDIKIDRVSGPALNPPLADTNQNHHTIISKR